MAQVMQVGSGWSRLLDRRQPYTLAEVAAMERRACRLVKIRSVGAGPTDAFICSAISFAMMSGMMTTRRLAADFGGPKAWPPAADWRSDRSMRRIRSTRYRPSLLSQRIVRNSRSHIGLTLAPLAPRAPGRTGVSAGQMEPPWGVEPQTYSLRVNRSAD
jgi:hypothetical protein